MLFLYSPAQPATLWMKDMQVPLDIIWIQGGVVADISRDVSNDFDPAAPRFYSPRTKVDTVLEVNAGFAQTHAIHIGDTLVETP